MEKLALFYTNLEYDKTRLQNQLVYRDLFDGHKKTTTINKMMQDSVNLSIKYINAMFKYSKSKITKTQLRKVIRDYNLNTGVLGKTKEDVVFTKKILNFS